MDYKIDGERLVLFLQGQISAKNAKKVEDEILSIIAKHPEKPVVFDASNLYYITSSGLRVLLGIQKLKHDQQGKIDVTEVNRDIIAVFTMTGFTTLMNVIPKLHEVSVEGKEIIGQGQSSTVYRMGGDFIIKLYKKDVPKSKIFQEIEFSRKAFIAGIPTAITFNVVKCGDSYGAVFEMVDHADTVGHTLTAHPEKFDDIMSKFVDTYKIIHNTDIKKLGGFMSLKDTWLKWADGMGANGAFTPQETDMLKQMIQAVPDRSTMVHCDYHAGNVMYQHDEIIVIDMADIGYGHPIFDLAGGAFHARYSYFPKRQKVHGMCEADMLRFWDTLLRMYFNVSDEKKLAEIKEMCSAFGLLRGAIFPMKHVQIDPETKAFHVEETRKYLFPRMDWAMEQVHKIEEIF